MTKQKPAKKPGPEPERVKLIGDWENAVQKALGIKRPVDGWPDSKPAKRKGKAAKPRKRKR